MKGEILDPCSAAKASGQLVTPLLHYIAGEHANDIERLWPAPHAGFLTLPTARRHAAAILLSGHAGRIGLSEARLANFVERQKDRAVAELIVGPAHSAGFMKLLNKCGEALWTGKRYRELLELFRGEASNLALRHMEEVSETSLLPITVLPADLRHPRVISFMPHLAASYDLAKAYDIVGRIGGREAQKRASDRWTRATTRMSLFSLAAEDLIPGEVIRPHPVPDLPAEFERISEIQHLKRVALEFKNCLADYAWGVAHGKLAVYVWQDEAPVAVALIHGVDGWRLGEAELADNQALPEPALKRLTTELLKHNVRIGGSTESLHNRLRNIGHQKDVHVYPEDMQPKSLADQCELGDLWQ